MFTLPPHDDLDAWFQHLNAPLTRLPADERAQLHLEVRQHLEGLVAANEELGSPPEEAWAHALAQFGDPAKIGRRLAWEWRRGRGVVSPDMAAVLYGLGAHVAATAALLLGTILVMMALRLYDNAGISFTLEYLIAVPILTGAAVGARFPQRALTGTFYAAAAWPLLPMMALVSASIARMTFHDLVSVAVWLVTWLTLGCGAAYLASARQRRQWYRPRWADLKLQGVSRAELMKPLKW